MLKDFKRHPIGKGPLGEKWGLSPKSSSVRLTFAALRSFGLTNDAPSKGESLVKLSDLGLDILVDLREDDPRHLDAIRQAALKPNIYSELYTKWGGDLPDESEVRRYLVRERNFNDNTVDAFIKGYKNTLEFARLVGDHTTKPSSSSVLPLAGQATLGVLGVGDFVQWTSQGVDQFSVPTQIAGLSEDGTYAFFEGSLTGVPVCELSAVPVNPGSTNNPSTGGATNPVPLPPVPSGFFEDVSTLNEGRVIVRIPDHLSAFSFEILEDFLHQALRKAWHSVTDDQKPSRPVKPERK